MKKKYYFENEDAEHCYTEEYFQDAMRNDELTEIIVLEAIPAKISESEFIYCKEIETVGEKKECGKSCPDYEPRNGKNGMCKNRGKLYEHGDEVTLIAKKHRCKCGGIFEFKEREGHVCQKCGWTKVFL